MVAIQLTPAAGPLGGLAGVAKRIEELGYEAFWIGEVNAVDAVVPATIIAGNTASLTVGALFNVYTRAPTNVAIAAAGLAQLAPGRIAIVLGASSPLLVERWNGIPYSRPYARIRDYLNFLRAALSGGRVYGDFSTFQSSGFALDAPPAEPPMLMVAAAMPRTIRLAEEHADGVVLNWLAPHDVERLGMSDRTRERVWLSTIVCPSTDRSTVDRLLRSLIADYLSAPAYAGLQRAVGRGPALEAMWERFAAGDRSGARAQLPAAVIDELVVSGTAWECGQWLKQCERDYGIHPITTLYLPEGMTFDDVARDLLT